MIAIDEHEMISRKLANGTMPPNEPLFTLRAQDQFAATVVRRWAELVEFHNGDPEKVKAARDIADMMTQWPVKNIPGRPAGWSYKQRNYEVEFRDKLLADRPSVTRQLMDRRVEEWMNDGTEEVARCLASWAANEIDLGDFDTVVELAEGHLWSQDGSVEKDQEEAI